MFLSLSFSVSFSSFSVSLSVWLFLCICCISLCRLFLKQRLRSRGLAAKTKISIKVCRRSPLTLRCYLQHLVTLGALSSRPNGESRVFVLRIFSVIEPFFSSSSSFFVFLLLLLLPSSFPQISMLFTAFGDPRCRFVDAKLRVAKLSAQISLFLLSDSSFMISDLCFPLHVPSSMVLAP